MSSGDFFLSDTLTSGSYYIRAYTQWMLNYGEGNFFSRPLPVLTLYDKVMPVSSSAPSLQNDVSVEIVPDKETYETREKISLAVKVKDEEGTSMPFDFSISVVDEDLVTPLQGRKTILDEFSRQTESSMGNMKATYPIEHGISLRGYVTNKSKKKEKFIVTIVQGNNVDIDAVDTDLDGRFNISGFQFTDSAEFAFQSKNIKGKIAGTVVLTEQKRIPLTNPPPPLEVSIQKKENPQRAILKYGDKSKILEEVVIKSTRLESDYSVMRHTQPDYILRGDALVKEKFTSVISALQNKIPSLRIIPIVVDGMLRYSVRFNLSTSAREPLLVINGLRYPAVDGIYQGLMQLNPYDIDYIEVSRFNGAMEFGVPATGGFISIYTKTRDTVGSTGSFNKKYFQIEKVIGYSVPIVFPSPDYSKTTESTDKVDFRSTIYWNSSLRSDSTGDSSLSFYSADFATHYKIVVEGMTTSGIPFHSERVIKIEEKK